jgi:hypothetical protein
MELEEKFSHGRGMTMATITAMRAMLSALPAEQRSIVTAYLDEYTRLAQADRALTPAFHKGFANARTFMGDV